MTQSVNKNLFKKKTDDIKLGFEVFYHLIKNIKNEY